VMTLEEALKAAELISPKTAVPMHFGKLLGSTTDAHRFEHLLMGKVPVTVLSTGE
jgi:L-ascorbate metabolism protein UlaG (beta-lactamase superfamily)